MSTAHAIAKSLAESADNGTKPVAKYLGAQRDSTGNRHRTYRAVVPQPSVKHGEP
jgi:hypothetical protein